MRFLNIVAKMAFTLLAVVGLAACGSDEPEPQGAPRLTAISEQLFGDCTWTFAYDVGGSLAKLSKTADRRTQASMAEIFGTSQVKAEYSGNGSSLDATLHAINVTATNASGYVTAAESKVYSTFTLTELRRIDYAFAYDDSSRLVSVKAGTWTQSPLGKYTNDVVTTFTYSPDGQLESCTASDGSVDITCAYSNRAAANAFGLPGLPMRLALDDHLLGLCYAGLLGRGSSSLPSTVRVAQALGINGQCVISVVYSFNGFGLVSSERQNAGAGTAVTTYQYSRSK